MIQLPLVNESLVFSTKERILAIDYGDKGGMVWNEEGGLIGISMPDTIRAKSELIKKIQPDLAIAETVHAFAGQGVVSVATFMRKAGEIDGICSALDIKLYHYNPAAWQEYFTNQRSGYFVNKGHWKKYLQKLATEITGVEWSLNCCDAALIWWYHASLINNIPSKSKLVI